MASVSVNLHAATADGSGRCKGEDVLGNIAKDGSEGHDGEDVPGSIPKHGNGGQRHFSSNLVSSSIDIAQAPATSGGNQQSDTQDEASSMMEIASDNSTLHPPEDFASGVAEAMAQHQYEASSTTEIIPDDSEWSPPGSIAVYDLMKELYSYFATLDENTPLDVCQRALEIATAIKAPWHSKDRKRNGIEGTDVRLAALAWSAYFRAAQRDAVMLRHIDPLRHSLRLIKKTIHRDLFVLAIATPFGGVDAKSKQATDACSVLLDLFDQNSQLDVLLVRELLELFINLAPPSTERPRKVRSKGRSPQLLPSRFDRAHIVTTSQRRSQGRRLADNEDTAFYETLHYTSKRILSRLIADLLSYFSAQSDKERGVTELPRVFDIYYDGRCNPWQLRAERRELPSAVEKGRAALIETVAGDLSSLHLLLLFAYKHLKSNEIASRFFDVVVHRVMQTDVSGRGAIYDPTHIHLRIMQTRVRHQAILHRSLARTLLTGYLARVYVDTHSHVSEEHSSLPCWSSVPRTQASVAALMRDNAELFEHRPLRKGGRLGNVLEDTWQAEALLYAGVPNEIISMTLSYWASVGHIHLIRFFAHFCFIMSSYVHGLQGGRRGFRRFREETAGTLQEHTAQRIHANPGLRIEQWFRDAEIATSLLKGLARGRLFDLAERVWAIAVLESTNQNWKMPIAAYTCMIQIYADRAPVEMQDIAASHSSDEEYDDSAFAHGEIPSNFEAPLNLPFTGPPVSVLPRVAWFRRESVKFLPDRRLSPNRLRYMAEGQLPSMNLAWDIYTDVHDPASGIKIDERFYSAMLGMLARLLRKIREPTCAAAPGAARREMDLLDMQAFVQSDAAEAGYYRRSCSVATTGNLVAK
ncbi:hypothetical protein EMMF5_004503 [Cystobasidiomycetes sp. EMM_F5]